MNFVPQPHSTKMSYFPHERVSTLPCRIGKQCSIGIFSSADRVSATWFVQWVACL